VGGALSKKFEGYMTDDYAARIGKGLQRPAGVPAEAWRAFLDENKGVDPESQTWDERVKVFRENQEKNNAKGG